MRFQVPQFIDVEDKIFGPLTLKQFIYIAGGIGVAVVSFSFLPKFFAVIISAPFVGVAVALAFYKPNNRPFVHALEAMVNFYLKDKTYIWKKIPKPIDKSDENNVTTAPELFVPSISGNKLKDLNLNLVTKKGLENAKTGL